MRSGPYPSAWRICALLAMAAAFGPAPRTTTSACVVTTSVMLDLPGQVHAIHAKTVAEISSVRQVPLVAGIQVQGVAAEPPGLALEKLQERRTQPAPVRGLHGDQVVEVDDPAPRHRRHQAVAGGRGYAVALCDVGDLIALAGLRAPARDEFLLGPQVRA